MKNRIHFKKLMKFRKFIENISLLDDQVKEQEIRILLTIFIEKNHLRKENMGQRNLRNLLNFAISVKYFTVA